MSVKNRNWSYLPEIDGLRAIAVLSVFLFHLNRKMLTGGFVGVDIFFVISGFLITSVLLNDLDQGHQSIARFYQHRIARIAPAFFSVLAITLITGAFIYSAQDFASLGANSVAAALSIINLKLLFQGNYFESSLDAQPLLHYWSLAVEEQFYLLFPIYLYLISRFARRPLATTVVVCALSFAACVIATPVAPSFAFYLLPTRAWELLVGSSLALLQRNGRGIAAAAAPIAVWAGLGLLGASFLFISEANFPGWIAAFPVVGTVLVLASICSGGGRLFRQLLANQVPVFIGKRSYSLYLWHWPVFSFVDYHFFLSSSVFRLTVKIMICVVATLLTYRFVEVPMRTYLNLRGHRLLVFGGFTAVVILVCAGGMEVRSSNYFSADPHDIAAGGIAVKGSRGRGTVVLIGDSQGAMYSAELVSLAHSYGFNLNVLSMAGGNELPQEPDTHWPAIEQFLAEHPPNVVIVAEAWSSKLGGDTEHLREALDSIKKYRSQVVLITQPPILPPDATREAIRAGVRPSFFEEPVERQERERATTAVDALASSSVFVIDVAGTFLDLDGAIRLIAGNGRFTYHDSHHLSDSGTALVRPMLERELIDALGRG